MSDKTEKKIDKTEKTADQKAIDDVCGKTRLIIRVLEKQFGIDIDKDGKVGGAKIGLMFLVSLLSLLMSVFGADYNLDAKSGIERSGVAWSIDEKSGVVAVTTTSDADADGKIIIEADDSKDTNDTLTIELEAADNDMTFNIGTTEVGKFDTSGNFTAAGTIAMGDGSVTNSELATGSVTSNKVKNANITQVKLANGDYGVVTFTSGSAAFDADVVDSAAIANNAVSNTELATGCVTSNKVNAGDITQVKLANGDYGVVTFTSGSAAFDASVVDAAAIANNAVSNTELAVGCVTSNKVNAGDITGSKLASEDMGDITVEAGVVAVDDNAVLATEVGAGALPSDVQVSSTNIINGTVVNEDLADVNLRKLALNNGGSLTNLNADSCAGVLTAIGAAGSRTEVITTPILTTYTFTNVVMTATDGSAEGESVQVADFNAGAFTILDSIVNAQLVVGTGVVGNIAISLGTAAASDAADLTGTEVDVIPSTTIDCTTVHTNAFDAILAAPANFDGTVTAKDLYVNVGAADASISGGAANTFTVTGTITLITTKAVDNQ
jgi:hypothetical protein